jgi:alcohol dehydrogenase (cytochrome c)/quinohemoprotein ethanol dehydrogenase
MRPLPILATASAVALASATGAGPATGGASDRLLHAADEPQNWLMYNGTYAEQRYAPLDQVNTANVVQLGLAWSYDLDSRRGQEGTPLVVDGTMFVTAGWGRVVALDGATGAKKWAFNPEVRGRSGLSACCDVVNRGAAYDNGKVFVGTTDGQLIALDANTGAKLWSVQTTDPAKPYTITGAPRVARGKVFIGNGGADYGARGFVTAYDQRNGAQVWRFYTVPGQPGIKDGAASDDILEKARGSWFGDTYWKIGGGGTVWDSIVYDPDLNRLYIGVGNGGPWNRDIRSKGKGDNLFLGSVVALDPDTGRYVWHYQETPGDEWDFTSTQQMVLADLRIDGHQRKVILHAPKNGFFYVIDRTSGKLISAEKFAPVNWADRIDLASGRPVENPRARYGDGAFFATSGAPGAHNWPSMSFDPRTGLVYIPVQMIPMAFTRDTRFIYRQGLWAGGVSDAVPNTDADAAIMNRAPTGSLLAWDPVRQKPAWTVAHEGPQNGGALATAGGLVFQGLSDGTFRAYRADTGAELWRFSAKATVQPGAISYRIAGVQYVAVTAGVGGAWALTMPAMAGPKVPAPPRVLVFRLGGKAVLPETVGVVPPLQQVDQTFAPAMVATGRVLFDDVCSVCHGFATMSGGALPDLKRSGVLPDADSWRQVVLGGALESEGMASFAKYFRPDQAEAIRAYVAMQARDAASGKMSADSAGISQ